MENNKLLEIVKRLSPQEVKVVQEAAKLIQSGADTLKYDKKKGKITATVIDDGTVNTVTRRISNVGDITQFSRTDISDKQARNEYIVSLDKQGFSQPEIAEIVGLTQPMIHVILKKAGVL